MLARILSDLPSAFSLLTRIPMPAHRHSGAASAWAWPLVGVAAGAASAWWLLRQSAPEWQPCLWQGAVAGVAPGLGWLLLAWLSTGDLGVDRLVGFGPRFPDLLLWATLPLALAGGLYGVGRALWLSRRAPAAEDAPTG